MSTSISYYFQHPEKFAFNGFFDDITETYEILSKIKPFLAERLAGVKTMRGEAKSADLHFYNDYFVDEGTVIYNDVTIIGPVYIGKNCEIMPGAILRPYTVLSDGCSVGHGSELKRCVMFSGAKVASLAFTGDTVLGASARIGSGVITANRKFNQSNAALKTDAGRVDLRDSFFGLILGDSARVGANSVTQPGTHIGPYSWIYPMTGVRGFIPREKRVYYENPLTIEDNGRFELKP